MSWHSRNAGHRHGSARGGGMGTLDTLDTLDITVDIYLDIYTQVSSWSRQGLHCIFPVTCDSLHLLQSGGCSDMSAMFHNVQHEECKTHRMNLLS